MQLGRAPVNACRPLARLCSSTRRICVVRATGTKPGSSNPVTQSLLDFFDDITEGARDGPRRRAAQLQERDVPDVTDIASKVHQAADAVEAAASNLQEMLGDASAAVTEAFGGLEGRVAGLKQQLLKGEKTIEAMVDEVVHVIGSDARKIASTLAGGDKQAADAAHAALDAAVARAQKLRSDATQEVVSAEHAAEEVVEIARAMLQEVQHLLTPKTAKTAGQTSGQTAGQTAKAAMTAVAEAAAKVTEAAKGDAAKPAAATSAAAATPAVAAAVPARQAAAPASSTAVADATAAAAVNDAAAAALEATAAAAAVIAEKGLAMAEKATDVEALAVALDAQVTSLRAKAGQLQLQTASGSTTTHEAVKALLGQFSDALGAIEKSVAAGTAASGANSPLQDALQRCRKDAASGARMVAEAAARQDISSERAVQYLSSLLRQLASDVSNELTRHGKEQQRSGAAGASRGASAAAPRAKPAPAAGFAASASGAAVSAAGLQDSEIVVASVDELELVLQDASSQSQIVRAAAKGFAAAEAAAASLQQRLPEFKQALTATAVGGDSESGRKAAARILTGAAGEVEGQLAELQTEMLAQSGGGEAGAAAAASLQLLRDSVEARVRELAGKVEAGQAKPAAALDELLVSLQSSIAGELRSCLLDSLSQSSTSSTASMSMSEDELAAQLSTAIAAARKEGAAAAIEGLEEAIAAGKLAAWVVKAAVGVGALQLVKAGAGMALERAGLALPGALGGMLGVAALLAIIGEAGAEPLVQFYDSYLSWTAGMLPLFYVPALAVVPSLLQGTDIAGLLGASLAGTAASLLFAAAFASLLTPKPSEASADTPQATSTSPAQPSSQQSALLAVAAFAAVGPLVLTKFDPTAFGQLMTVPVGLAWSLFGFLAGRAVGVNPMVVGAVAATAGVFWHGKLMGWGYNVAIDAFFGQGAGAGELLTAVVGMALTGLGFAIYKQRRSISIPAVAVTAVAAAAFNVMSTVGATHLVPLTAVWCKAFVARGIPTTMAPAVASSMGASPELAAIAVLLQAAVTVVLGGTLLKLFAGNNEAAAGIAAGCTAGGIGAAAVSQNKPAGSAALANGVLAYAAVHVLSAAMLGVPAVGETLQTAVAMAAA